MPTKTGGVEQAERIDEVKAEHAEVVEIERVEGCDSRPMLSSLESCVWLRLEALLVGDLQVDRTLVEELRLETDAVLVEELRVDRTLVEER